MPDDWPAENEPGSREVRFWHGKAYHQANENGRHVDRPARRTLSDMAQKRSPVALPCPPQGRLIVVAAPAGQRAVSRVAAIPLIYPDSRKLMGPAVRGLQLNGGQLLASECAMVSGLAPIR